VKASAFMPTPAPLETSVFRISELDDAAVWDVGDSAKPAATGAKLHARAEILASEVRTIGLAVAADPAPLIHAAIVNWPAEKEDQMVLARLLAEVARPVPR
jgi:hypothetical protein